jgi:LPS-assembly lipoprotein
MHLPAALRRRTVLTALAAPLGGAGLLSLAGCGFQPIYAKGPEGGGVSAELAAVEVGLIPERTGQLLRLALQDRLERGGVAPARRYDLAVSFALSGDPIAVAPDSSITRLRLTGTAHYVLTAQDPTRTTLTSGTARSVDGLNVFQNQLFAVDLESETVQRRIAEAVADQIVLQLAAYFHKRLMAAR